MSDTIGVVGSDCGKGKLFDLTLTDFFLCCHETVVSGAEFVEDAQLMIIIIKTLEHLSLDLNLGINTREFTLFKDELHG